MSSVWRIYYDFLSATTKLLSPKSRWLRFAKMRVAFVSPKSVAVPVRAQVARFIVDNNRETMVRSRRPFVAAAGWSFPVASSAKTPLASFRQNARRPHAEEHRSATQAQVLSAADARCGASRSMRAHALARPHPSRRAYAHSSLRKRLRMRAPQDEDAHACRSAARR